MCPYLCEFTPSLISEYPKQIEFSYDRRCNIRCIFCRDNADEEEKRFNIEKAQRVEQNFDKIFSTVLQHAEIVELNSAGELFASKQSIEILKRIIEEYPHIRFKIISNGILFSKEMIEKLNIKDKMYSVTISMHAATKKTYNKLIEHGNFDAVLENVKYLSELKKQGLLSALQLNFVVTGYNYKEMKKFVKLAKELDARAFFINYHRQISSDKLQNELDISLPKHPKYNQLIKLLHNSIFKDEHCCINSYLLNLKPVKKNIKIKIKEWLKIH